MSESISNYVARRNREKMIFTAGPGSLLEANLTGLRPAFGRGDPDYAEAERTVMHHLLKISGQNRIACLQGSASMALEIATANFLHGKILVINTGYYSNRLVTIAESSSRLHKSITSVTSRNWTELDSIAGSFDWILACSTETSVGLKIPIEGLKKLATRTRSKLMLDATASIGLEGGHELADVAVFSSCKGLFGLTGASFIAFQEMPHQVPDSFYLNLSTHLNHLVTGPYHSILSLVNVLPNHHYFRQAVINNKAEFLTRMQKWLDVPPENQPLLCTHTKIRITTDESNVVLYSPRGQDSGSVVCHLGEIHLGPYANGDIFNCLSVANA
jgi:2-aminoethylphosphonate-pyruvate transaminase